MVDDDQPGLVLLHRRGDGFDAARPQQGGRLRTIHPYGFGMDNLKRDAEVLTVTAEGFGKRTPTVEYRLQSRGGKGIINLKVTKKTGVVVGLKVVQPGQELMLITTEGIVIRTDVDDISVISRNTQGVMLMKTESGDKVASLATMEQKSE